MRRLLAITFYLFIASAQAQNFVTAYGGINNDEALAIGQDENGAFYTTGYFNSSSQFQGTSIQSNGLSDIFVAKTNDIGSPNWVFAGGSPGPDRGFDIAVAADGSSCITGFLSNNANFGGASYPTNALSQDFFVLKLTPSGAVDWVRVFGGELGDTGYGVDIDPSGNVIVTGQFRGTIDFDGTTFTSTPLEAGGLSYDTFILKLDPAGNVLWAKHGQNAYESRGLDIKADASGNIVVCGQFSDTLTFDQTHNNDVFNAAFLVKFDPQGNEQWFRRFTSSQTIAYALAINDNDEIYVTGDNIGPLYFFEEPDDNAYFPVEYTYNLFLAKFSSEGELTWLTTNGSENDVSSKAIDLDAAGNPYVTGTFNCRFDEYSEEYGSGIFYSAGWRDIYISKFSASDGSRQWSRHVASRRDDYCSAITLKNADMPLISGSFEDHFVVTNANTFSNLDENEVTTIGADICGDNAYGNLRYVTSQGNKDIFLTAPINLDREPLDYFQRPSGDCFRPYRVPCVNGCEDSLVHCGPEVVNFTDFAHNVLAPIYDMTWDIQELSNPDLYDVPVTGTYHWTYSRLDGCFTFSDSLHATIHPEPLPLISDDVIVNTNAPPDAFTITLCYPDTVLFVGSNYSPDDQISWSSFSQFQQTDSLNSIIAYQPGTYTFSITNSFGCSIENDVTLEFIFPFDTITPFITFPAYEDPVDTISICEDDGFEVWIVDSLGTSFGDLIDEPTNVEWSISGNGNVYDAFTLPFETYITVPESGLYTIHVLIHGFCGGDTVLTNRQVYVELLPEPYIDVSLQGDGEICPGDTSIFIASGAENYNWDGPGFIQLAADSILAWISGYYSISSQITNEFGCTDSDAAGISLDYREAPEVSMLPESGIVCPGDSVMLTTETGLSYVWVGPQGQTVGSEQSIWVDIPGFYHCVLTDLDSCVIESNFVEVKEYSSPYLVMSPGNDLCFSGSIEIEAVTDPSAAVYWEPPLNTTGHVVTVTEPGEYTAAVTLCGITTTQTVTVYETEVNAFVNLFEPPTVCNGDSVLLDGNPGMFAYEWQPGGIETEDLWVTEPGEYTLFTYDEQGCEGVSETIEITGQPEVNLVDLAYNTLCPPDSIQLSAQGDFVSFNWLPNNDTTPTIWVTAPGTYQLEAVDANGCTGLSEIQEIVPGESPVTPQFDDEVHCLGETFVFSATVNGQLVWGMAPDTASNNPLVIDNLEADTTLFYALQGSNGCLGDLLSFDVLVVDSAYSPEIFGPESICAGDSLLLTTDWLSNSTFAWELDGETLSSGDSLWIAGVQTAAGNFSVQLTVNVANCAEGLALHPLTVLPLPPLLPISGEVHICGADSSLLYTSAPDSVTPTWQWQSATSTNDSLLVFALDNDSTMVELYSAWNGCFNGPTQAWIYLQPYPEIDSVVTNSPVCAEETLTVSAAATENANVTIEAPWGGIFANQMQLFPADTIYTGTYQIAANTDYCETIVPVFLEVFPLPDFDLGNDSTYCEGSIASFTIDDYDLVFWNDTIFGNSYSTAAPGIVKAAVINTFGCSKKDSVYVGFEECDGLLYNVFSPNGDGVNDVYNFNPYGFEELRVIIYNRWGKVVCELINVNEWDGIHCKTGRPVSHGTYFYIVEYVTREYANGTKSGYIQVFK